MKIEAWLFCVIRVIAGSLGSKVLQPAAIKNRKRKL